jgi:hypothetical protein
MGFNSAFKGLIWEHHSVVFKERGLSFMDGNMEGRKKNMHWQFVLEPSHRFVQDRGKTYYPASRWPVAGCVNYFLPTAR